MDNRRLIIAVVVSFTMMLGWSYFSQFMGWAPSPEEVQKTQQQAPVNAQQPVTPGSAAPAAGASNPAAPLLPAESFVPTPGQDVTVKTPLYTAVFNSSGGVLRSFTLANYMDSNPETGRASDRHKQLIDPQAAAQAPLGIILNNRPSWLSGEGAAAWSYEGQPEVDLKDGSASVTFHGRLGDLSLTRVFTFHADSYVFDEKTSLSSPAPQLLNYSLQLVTGPLAGSEEYMKTTYMARQQNGSFAQEDSIKDLAQGMNLGSGVSWAGNMGTYFLAAIIPADQGLSLRDLYQNNTYQIILDKNNAPVGGGQTVELNNQYYFGPKRVADLETAPGGLISALDYGWFGWIAAPLLIMLKWLHGFVGNWGLAIIALTVIIKVILAPLSYKSYKSMEQMRKVQPLMQKIREKYKDDKQRQNQEVMQLYKTYKVNPAGGCLPILVQLPIFLGLYRALLYSIELRQASFIPTLPFTDIVWLADLSLKDPLYITPIIMGLTMLLQQKMTPTTGDPTQAKIMMFMPIIFTVLFINFPAGLVLYWLVNNVLSIAQQHWQLNRKKS